MMFLFIIYITLQEEKREYVAWDLAVIYSVLVHTDYSC